MKDRELEKALTNFGKSIYVNKNLKHDLRESFQAKNPRPAVRFGRYVAAAAAFLLLAGFMLTMVANPGSVSATALNVDNYMSFVDMGGGAVFTACEHGGAVYLQVADKGLFRYDKKGLTRIYEGLVTHAAVSRDGNTLLFSEKDSIKTLDLKSGKVREVLKGDGKSVAYESPSWINSGTILFTKRTLEVNNSQEYVIKASEICKADLRSLAPVKLGEGEFATYVNGKDAIVISRDSKVLYKSLKDGSERVINEDGRFPNASPDGRYIAFTKSETAFRDIKENVRIEESLQNIWIVDTGDLAVRKKVTSNYVLKFMDEKEWLQSLQPSNELQSLAFTGKYCYFYPTWSSDSKSIFAFRRADAAGGRGFETKLIKISLDKGALSLKDTVGRYLQAVCAGDDDYVKSLAVLEPVQEGPGSWKMAGYGMGASGKADGMEYVDVETHWSLEGGPGYRSEKARYFAVREDGRYIIKNKKVTAVTEVSEEKGSIQISRDGTAKQRVFSVGDIPGESLFEGGNRISSVAFSAAGDALYFALQGNGGKEVKIFSYRLGQKQLKMMDDIKPGGGTALAPGRLAADAAGGYVEFDYRMGEKGQEISTTLVYDIKNNTKTNMNDVLGKEQPGSVKAEFWDGNVLYLGKDSYGRSLRFRYDMQHQRFEEI